jgi:hypothetical protein
MVTGIKDFRRFLLRASLRPRRRSPAHLDSPPEKGN